MGHIEKYNREANTITVAQYGTAGYVDLQKTPFWANDVCYSVIPNDNIVNKYLYYALMNQQELLYSMRTDAVPPCLRLDRFETIRIPLPPLPVQQEIVRILDNLTELTTELNKKLDEELAARRKQYEHYRDELLTFGENVHRMKLGDFAVVTKLAGFEFTKYVTYSDEGEIIALRGLNVKNGKLNLEDVKYIDGSDFAKLNRSKLHAGDMLFTYVGTVGQVALVDEDNKYYLAPNVALIRFDLDKVLPQFMRYFFQTGQFWKTEISQLLQSSSMKNIPMEKIRKFVLPVPTLDEQKRCVALLDHFDNLCNDLTSGLPAEIAARQKQYEYYRDKLLTFKELEG